MHWKVLESKALFKAGYLHIREDKCELPDGRIMPRYYVIEFPDWVNVFPVTREGEVLLLKQYRQASGKVHIEVPGGSSDPHRHESMQEAALRELLEETGYEAGEIVKVGAHYPNPALQGNQMHSYVALDCKKVAEPNLDPYEDLELYPCSLQQVEEHLLAGDIDHSIMVTSITMALNYLKNNHK